MYSSSSSRSTISFANVVAGCTLSLALAPGLAAADLRDFSYTSSVDGETLTGQVFVPPSVVRNGSEIPLVVYLHGGGGEGRLSREMRVEMAERGWIGIAPDGRRWGLAAAGCDWPTSAAYVDSPDPAVGPGEQDILDAIDWAEDNYAIDDRRIYLMGFSMGGRGTLSIGLKNPDRFAAIAPLSPAIDMYEISVRRPEPRACKEGMVGGKPGDSAFVDTMYTITSGRFLIENALNLPVFHAHGTKDHVSNNDPAHAPFLHGWHLTQDTSWSGCHGTSFCFGHTPTLSELQARHPSGYEWAFMFTPVEHVVDPRWLTGARRDPSFVGVDDPNRAGALLGVFDFFERYERIKKPRTVVYKTYTDTHDKAYWTTIKITKPWQNTPGAIRAERDRGANSLDLELLRVKKATVRLKRAKLKLKKGQPLHVTIDQLNEPSFDPALTPAAAALDTTIILKGGFKKLKSVTVKADGQRLAASGVALGKRKITIGPLAVDRSTLLKITAKEKK